MADTSIARSALGATTTNRKWFLDVWDGDLAAYVGVFGIQEFKPVKAAITQDTSDFSSVWKGNQVNALSWSLEGKLKRATTAASDIAYDPGQEILRAASDLTGVPARVKVRWYEMEPGGPRVEAYEGYGTVEWTEDGGNMEAISAVTLKINGDGERTAIAHPQPAVPYIASILPAGQSVGELVTITGTNLGGVTSGSFDSQAFVDYTIVDNQHIVVKIPTGAAGAGNVTVTSAEGTSAAVSYTTV